MIARFVCLFLFVFPMVSCSQQVQSIVSKEKMQAIYETIRTPHKYGVVFKHPDSTKMIDSPSIFRWKGGWRMTYIVFDGRGYETWLAESRDLLNWRTMGRIMSFTDTGWDANQKAGYMALLDTKWGGSYEPVPFNGNYWMSYLGGSAKGYEAGRLGVGIAYSEDPGEVKEWSRLPKPVLSANDADANWFDKGTIFKSFVIRDAKKHTGKNFVMYYNAAGDTASFESIGMAVSDDMIRWERSGEQPLISQYKKGSICGDAQITKIGNIYVMFYFGAFWKNDGKAFERFACSYDLIHWTNWDGEDLISPSESYDKTYAHKPFVIKWKGVVYHFYNAVGEEGRVIALATSRKLNKKIVR